MTNSTVARPATLEHPALLPTMSGYAVVADDAPGSCPRIGDVRRVGSRWSAWPMGAEVETDGFKTRGEAVTFVAAVAR